MERTILCSDWLATPAMRRHAKRLTLGSLLLFGLLPAGHSDSTFKTAPAGAGPLSATAHLDFRVTILPSLGLALQGQGLRVQGNSGPLTLQSNNASSWDGRAPSSSVQLRPRLQVIDAAIPAAQFNNGALITLAAP
jgi:hypothetical protein